MATREKDLMCANVVQKLTTGASLDDAEKSHLAACEHCMAEVVCRLDESGANKSHDAATLQGGANGDMSHRRPETQKALEHGRRVFEREFGISLPRS